MPSFFAGALEAEPDLAAAPPADLPFVHGSTADTIRQILHDGEIKTSFCIQFGQELSYVFRGRPDYFKRHDGKHSADYGRLPAFLVFDAACPIQTTQHHPFDTGAWGQYTELHTWNRPDFRLNPTSTGASRVIDLYYGGDNEAYFDRESSEGLTFISDIANAYGGFISAAAPYDDGRRSAIEVASAECLTLSGWVIGAVLPDRVYEEASVRDALADLGCAVRLYEVRSAVQPDFVRSEARGLVKSLLREAGSF